MSTQPSSQILFPDFPEGTVTFLFTDIEGSTQLLHQLREKYASLLDDHRRILREVFTRYDGREVDTQGDAFFIAFSRATQAVAAAVESQRNLSEHAWPEGVAVKVRMGIHTGEPWSAEQGYVGIDVHRAARIAHVGHGGQVLLSETTAALVQDELTQGVTLLDLGRHLLKDIHRPERISQLVIEGVPSEFPPLTSLEMLPTESVRPPRKVGACPFRGLSAFQEADAQFYFGREAFVDALEQAVTTHKLVAVILGSSGSGKSSAIFAGLLPRLRKQGGYLFATFRPGTQPFYSLAAALVPLLEPNLSKTDRLTEIGKLAEQLRRGKEVRLSQVIENLQSEVPTTRQVLLVVDQFEELYTLCPEAGLQKAFIDELLALVEASQARRSGLAVILLTMRADFMGQALLHRPFADALQEATLLMGPMNRQELYRAIERPAELQGAAFEPGLIERILDDVGEKPGNLPLLEFTLTQLWERQTDGWLTHADYEAMGSVEGALAAYADQVFAELDPSEQERARYALVQLVKPGEGTEDTRRIATHEELGDESWKLIQHLANKRLVVTGRDAQGHETVEVVHEALIQKWGRFQEWMNADRAFRLWQERMRANMRQWQESGHDEGTLLAGTPLAVAQSWLADRSGELSVTEAGYIQASQVLHAKQQKERQRRRQWTFAGLAAGLVIALALAAVAMVFGQRATQNAIQARQNQATAQSASILALNEADARATQQAIAEAEKANAIEEANIRTTAEANALVQADLARARELSLAAISNLNVDAERSILLALEAISIAQKTGGTVLPEFQDALHRAVLSSRLRFTLRGHTKEVWTLEYSPDGTQLATASWDGTAKIWDGATGRELHTLIGHRTQLWDIAYSPDGDQLATGDDEGAVILWSSKTGEKLANLAGHTGSIFTLVFSPDGKQLATASQDHTVRVWDTNTGNQLIVLSLNLQRDDPYSILLTHYLYPCLAFSPDGTRLLASLGFDTQWWDTQTWNEVSALQGTAATINPDGNRLALGDADGRVHLVDAVRGIELFPLSGNLPEAILSLAFSQDGSRLVANGIDNVQVWDANMGELLFHISGLDMPTLLITPDGTRLIISDRGIVKVWDIDLGTQLFTLAGSKAINNLVLSPGCDNPFALCGAHLATASSNQTAQVWDISPSGSSERLVIPAYWGYFNPQLMRLNTREMLSNDTFKLQILDFSPENFGKVLYSYTAKMPAEITGAATSRDGTHVALLSSDTTFSIFDVVDGKEVITFPVVNKFTFLILNPDFTRLAVLVDGSVPLNTIQIWDTTTGQKLFDIPELSMGVANIEYSLDGKYLAAAVVVDGINEYIYLFDTGTYQQITSWFAHPDVIDTLTFSPDGTRLLSTSVDLTAKVWQVPSGKELFTLQGHQAGIPTGIFNQDGTQLATSSYDGTIKVWDAFTGQLILSLSDPTYIYAGWLSFSPDGKYLASRDYSKTRLVHVYLLDINDLVDLARSRLTRGFTLEECQQYLHQDTCPSGP